MPTTCIPSRPAERDEYTWLEEGDQLFLLMDVNEDIRTGGTSKMLLELGLREVLLKKHGNDAPPTYSRGRIPIDRAFAMASLMIRNGGYTGIGEAIPGDHRCLWMDTDFQNAFGQTMLAIIRHKARRLQCTDPKIVQNWTTRLDEFIKDNDLIKTAVALETQSKHPISVEDGQEYESLDQLRCQSVAMTEANCRTLKMGGVQWSPTVKKAMRGIEAWTLLTKRSKGLRVSSRYLTRMMKEAEIPEDTSISTSQCNLQVKKAYKHYYQIKQTAETTRETWLEGLAQEKAIEGKTTEEKMLKQL